MWHVLLVYIHGLASTLFPALFAATPPLPMETRSVHRLSLPSRPHNTFAHASRLFFCSAVSESWILLDFFIIISSGEMIWNWSTSAVRFVHVALDTIVLYGVLREGSPAGRGSGRSGSRSNRSSSAARAPTVFTTLRPRAAPGR